MTWPPHKFKGHGTFPSKCCHCPFEEGASLHCDDAKEPAEADATTCIACIFESYYGVQAGSGHLALCPLLVEARVEAAPDPKPTPRQQRTVEVVAHISVGDPRIVRIGFVLFGVLIGLCLTPLIRITFGVIP